MPDRPSTLFLMSDEHRPDAAGFAGDDVVRTPVLDHLASTGVVFANAYTPSPVCIPGRQAIMAGQFPRTCGCEHFGEDLASGHMTYARRLAQFGYRTVVAGKLHHTGTEQMQGWTHRIGMDSGIAAHHIPDRYEASFAGLPEPMRHKWSMVKEVQRTGVGGPPYLEADGYALEGARKYMHQHFMDSYYDRPIPEVPLLLKVSLWQPHYPFQAPDQESFDHPVLGGEWFVVRPGIEVTKRDHRRATAAYYAMVEAADRMYGHVLDALRHADQDLDDWTIVYTSDHGEMLGEHGVYEKQRFFDPSAGVPLLIRWPRRFASRAMKQNVSLCDLFATLCDLTGVPVPDGLDSRSLTQLTDGNTDGSDDEAISQLGNRLMIKRGSLKYQHYGDEGPDVYSTLPRTRARRTTSSMILPMAARSPSSTLAGTNSTSAETGDRGPGQGRFTLRAVFDKRDSTEDTCHDRSTGRQLSAPAPSRTPMRRLYAMRPDARSW